MFEICFYCTKSDPATQKQFSHLKHFDIEWVWGECAHLFGLCGNTKVIDVWVYLKQQQKKPPNNRYVLDFFKLC